MSDDLDPTEPHPEAPTDDDGQPIDPQTGDPICGIPKRDPEANFTPYCRRSSHWVLKTGYCFEHQDRNPDPLFPPRRE